MRQAFMLLEPGERSKDQRDVAADLATLAGAVNSVVILAESAGRPAMWTHEAAGSTGTGSPLTW